MTDRPSHECPHCGKPIGWLGRLLMLAFGPVFHRCKAFVKVEPQTYRGHDLSRWDYLGSTKITINYTDTGGEDWSLVHYFLTKDGDRRDYDVEVVADKFPELNRFRRHQYVVSVSDQWRIGERPLWEGVVSPSMSMKRLMVADGYVWSDVSRKWERSMAGPFPVPPAPKRVVKPSDGNVIEVDFKK